MLEDYKNALKSGQRAYRACVARGQSPYLAVLDDILVNVNIVSQEPLGLVEIPAESIVGTKTSGRHTAFAPNFMPLLEADTEFAAKWSNLCEAHLEEGIQNPILAYEFMNRFYVQEGNKRVSVLKYYGAVKIAGTVTRLIPARNDSLENRIYYEFLDFYKLSQINYVHFSRTGGYAKLQTLVCKASGESWTEDDRLNFSSFYTVFRQQFIALGGHDLKLTTGDGLLVYLSVYRYADACEATPAQVKENLEKLWTEVKVLTEPQAVELSLEPAPSAGEPLLAKLNIFSSKPSELKVAFLHENNAENSAWVRNHNKGRDALEQAFPDRLTPTTLVKLIGMVQAGRINRNTASKVFRGIFAEDLDPEEWVTVHGLEQIRDERVIAGAVARVLEEHPQSAADYRAGKEKALGFLMGRVMKELKGKADPGAVNALLKSRLETGGSEGG